MRQEGGYEVADARLVIKAGRLIDGTGAPPQTNVALIARGGIIQETVPLAALRPAPDDKVIDASGQTVIPGLIDAHVHIQSDGDPGAWRESIIQHSTPKLALIALVNARKSLAMGYTGLRDMGCRDYVDVSLRDAIEVGEVDGPRLRVSGMPLSMYGGHFAPRVRREVTVAGFEHCIVNTVDEARAAARYQLAMGADQVKMSAAGSEYAFPEDGIMCWPEFDYAMMAAVVAQASKIGRLTAVHCHGGQGATDAIRAGVKTIEHGHWLTGEQLAMMAERDAIFVPTFSPNSVPFELARQGQGKVSAWRERAVAAKFETFALALREGVKIAAGSDSGFDHIYHGRQARELLFMVEAGMSPLQALRSATAVAAETMGLAGKTGTLTPGKWLDAVVVDGDPLADIKLLLQPERIKVVIRDGRILVDRRTADLEAALPLHLKTPRGLAPAAN
jgi:imidazolonepropionase-like amidohydrolase